MKQSLSRRVRHVLMGNCAQHPLAAPFASVVSRVERVSSGWPPAFGASHPCLSAPHQQCVAAWGLTNAGWGPVESRHPAGLRGRALGVLLGRDGLAGTWGWRALVIQHSPCLILMHNSLKAFMKKSSFIPFVAEVCCYCVPSCLMG